MGIIALGARGDIQPYVALGKGLQQAGYEVCVLTHEAFEGLVRGKHLEFFAVGDAYALAYDLVSRASDANLLWVQ